MSGCGCACPVNVTTATQVPASNVEAVALAANNNRRNATIENHGTQPVYVYFATGQGATAPILLPQYGVWTALQTGVLYTGTVYVITASSTTTVGVVEET